MATIQVILAGQLRTTIHDTFDYPIVLQFNSKTSYDEAEWVIPSYPRHIPAHRLSEIRVQEGNVSVLVDGPEGFRHGPFPFTWVRSYYPRGHHCAFVQVEPGSYTKMAGVALTTHDGTLFLETLPIEKDKPAEEPPAEEPPAAAG
jgi:hypothetical protein